jgi:hypothetical protein
MLVSNEVKVPSLGYLREQNENIVSKTLRKLFTVNSLKEVSDNQIDGNQGNHRFEKINLDSGQARELILYACAAAAVQKNKHNWMDPFGYKPIKTPNFELGLEQQDSVLFDRWLPCLSI